MYVYMHTVFHVHASDYSVGLIFITKCEWSSSQLPTMVAASTRFFHTDSFGISV